MCKDIPTLVFVAGPLTLLYFVQVEFEEVRLSRMFPQVWSSYVASTPRLFPRRITKAVWHGWSQMEWLRNREYRAIGATLLGLAAVTAWHYARTQML